MRRVFMGPAADLTEDRRERQRERGRNASDKSSRIQSALIWIDKPGINHRPTSTGLCPALRDSARLYRTLPGSAGLCPALPDSARLYRTLPGSAGLCPALRDSARLYRTLPGSAGLCGPAAAQSGGAGGGTSCRCEPPLSDLLEETVATV
ncbi:hypothetical protein L3Q82_003674 [Scortum barcoo]|uniref:Uncharacterized protein n=1 Tax=Scortum barcoo TaxID=214431 RepID=A0ACB8VNQ2_9TELE|nr:hypothetical protein L3Q82_003674 [Scortum barcoo]